MLKLISFLRPQRGKVLIVFLLAIAGSMANLFLPRFMSEIVDRGIVPGDTRAIVELGALMLLVAFFATVCSVTSSFFSARIAGAFGRDVRRAVFARAERLSLHQFDDFGAASLVTRTTNDTTQVQQMLIMILTMVIAAPIMAVGGVALAMSQDPELAWVLVAAMPVMALVFGLVMRKSIPLSTIMQDKIDRLNLVLAEGLSGVRVIRAFDRGVERRERFAVANRDLTDTAIAVNRLVAVLWPALMLMFNLTSVAIILVGAHRVGEGSMHVGALISSLQYTMQILFAVFMVTAMFVMLPRASASAARIHAVLEIAPDIVETIGGVQDHAALRTADAGRTDLEVRRNPAVEFQHVTFQYPGADEPALSDVSFVARAGEVTAIVGGTGSGKTTLAGLIPRFYDTNTGRVLVDGVDVREWPLDTLRAGIGFVPQKAVLFTGTVAANIRYGREDATDEDVRKAADIAQALEFVQEIPGQFDAPISQGGSNLSGGQKQRLSIARAIVRRPAIYVLDDSFSALDFATDARLRAALRRETADATVFVVAQRVSTIVTADRIVVLDDGRVAGIGTHAELLATNAVYREIVESQAALEVA